MSSLKFPLPPQSIRFMGEDDEEFIEIANQTARLLMAQGLCKNDRLLDLGCGYGRLTYGLANELAFEGQYYGLDILRNYIEWCKYNIKSISGNYDFGHLDIFNARYNPNGVLSAKYIQFDMDHDFDFVSLFSVFTHMYEEEIRNYLQQIHITLIPNGRCLATFFLYDELRLPNITKPENTLCMGFQMNDHTRYHNADDKLHAICFEKSYIEKMIIEAGFAIVKTKYGTWGGGEEFFQDYIVMEKKTSQNSVPKC